MFRRDAAPRMELPGGWPVVLPTWRGARPMDVFLPDLQLPTDAGAAGAYRAGRAATIIDNAAYFAAAREAMLQARHSILLLGWGFDPRTVLVREGADDGWPTQLGAFLETLATRRPHVAVRLLIWDMAWPIAAANSFFPQRARRWFGDGPVKLRLDGTVPSGASHHQKLLIVDGRLAFSGGGDFMANRWDTAAHADGNLRRRLPSGAPYKPRHEVMLLVEGAAAEALDRLARERWRRATGEILPQAPAGESCWPASVRAEVADARISVARTDPYAPGGGVRVIERAYAAAIASARRLIYLENQYFTAGAVGDMLAARLAEPAGPQIVVVTSRAGGGATDKLTMDLARDALIARLRAADRHGRFHVYAPLTSGGMAVCVHSKVMVIDDRMLSVGSANLNNRSLGLDTECDVAIHAPEGPRGEPVRRMIAAARDRLLGHFIGASPRALDETFASDDAVAALLASLDRGQNARMLPMREMAPGALRRWIARWQLGDPRSPEDVWRPWRRGASAGPRVLADAQRRYDRQMV